VSKVDDRLRAASIVVVFAWRFLDEDGGELGTSERFPDRDSAESWIGETWPDLVERGIEEVVLVDAHGHRVFRMGLGAE
jgi:hypothetical protein